MRKLVLGSSSQPRQELLRRLRIPFDIAEPNIDETPQPNEIPIDLVLRLAETKARKVAEQYPDAYIIGADQVGILENHILCKPYTYENAVAQLQRMSNKRIDFLIGLCVFDAINQSKQIALDTFTVTFRPLTLKMIEKYLQKENALQCAGSFKAEGLGITLVDKFHDTDFSALIGLPLIRLNNMLENIGLGPLQ